MEKTSQKLWVLGLIVGAVLGATGPSECAAQQPFPMSGRHQSYPIGGKPSIVESISTSIREGLDKLGRIATPRTPVKPADDPVALSTEAEPGVELYVAVARLYEESGKLSQAAERYQEALQREPDSLGALLGYARLKDRLGEPREAERLYRRAIQAHPNEASAHNNLALFYARRGMPNESIPALRRAIQLQPKNPKYRNNIATVLVQMGETREAYRQLRAVHREAVACHNLGYLLEKKGQLQAAAQQFAIALQTDPSLAPARRGLQRVQQRSISARMRANPSEGHLDVPPNGRAGAGVRMGSRRTPAAAQTGRHASSPGNRHPMLGPLGPSLKRPGYGAAQDETGLTGGQPDDLPPMPPDSSVLTRLPPTSGQRTVAPTPAPRLPGPYDRQPTLNAPLPPRTTQRSVFQRGPRAN